MHHLFGLQDWFPKECMWRLAWVQMLFIQSQPVHFSYPSFPAILFKCGSMSNVVRLMPVIKVWHCVLTAVP